MCLVKAISKSYKEYGFRSLSRPPCKRGRVGLAYAIGTLVSPTIARCAAKRVLLAMKARAVSS